MIINHRPGNPRNVQYTAAFSSVEYAAICAALRDAATRLTAVVMAGGRSDFAGLMTYLAIEFESVDRSGQTPV